MLVNDSSELLPSISLSWILSTSFLCFSSARAFSVSRTESRKCYHRQRRCEVWRQQTTQARRKAFSSFNSPKGSPQSESCGLQACPGAESSNCAHEHNMSAAGIGIARHELALGLALSLTNGALYQYTSSPQHKI